MAKRHKLFDLDAASENAGTIGASNNDSTAVSGVIDSSTRVPTENRSSVSAVEPETAERTADSSSSRDVRNRARSESRKSDGTARSARDAKRKENAERATENLAVAIHSVHLGLYMLSKAPEVCISKEEAERWADSINRVNQEFSTSIISPKASALLNLATVTGSIYGPRYIAYKIRKSKEKEAKKQQQEMQSGAQIN
jgi:hypothetical protein